MAKIIALFNQGGGFGKTTLTQNLSYQLAKKKRSVLAIDMDSQGTLTTFMGMDKALLKQEQKPTIYHALMGDDVSLPSYKNDVHGCSLVPATIDLEGAEVELVNEDMRESRLKETLEMVQEEYDFILIDCPANIGLLSLNSLVAATHVLIPIECSYKGLDGINQLAATIARIRKRLNKKLAIAGIIPTRYDGRNNHSSRALLTIQEQVSPMGEIYPIVRYAIAFADASEQHQPLGIYNPRHEVVKVLGKIAGKLLKL